MKEDPSRALAPSSSATAGALDESALLRMAEELCEEMEQGRRRAIDGTAIAVGGGLAVAVTGWTAWLGVTGAWLVLTALVGCVIGASAAVLTLPLTTLLGEAAVRLRFKRLVRDLGLPKERAEQVFATARAAVDEAARLRREEKQRRRLSAGKP